MKVMRVISYIICGLGIYGGLMMLVENDLAGAIMALVIYGFFLALTVNIKKF
jgi:hypothetical protein